VTENNISLYTSITYNYKPDVKITLIHCLYAKILILLLSCYGRLYVITSFGFAGCDSVIVLLICESVWNKLNADILFYKFS